MASQPNSVSVTSVIFMWSPGWLMNTRSMRGEVPARARAGAPHAGRSPAQRATEAGSGADGDRSAFVRTGHAVAALIPDRLLARAKDLHARGALHHDRAVLDDEPAPL